MNAWKPAHDVTPRYDERLALTRNFAHLVRCEPCNAEQLGLRKRFDVVTSEGDRYGLCPVLGAQLPRGVHNVEFDGLRCDAEAMRDLLACLPMRDKLENPAFSLSEPLH